VPFFRNAKLQCEVAKPFFGQRRFVKTSPGDLKKGDWLWQDGKPVIVTAISSSCSGRGSRSYTVTIKCAYTGQLSTVRPVGGDGFDRLDHYDEIYSFLYQEGDTLYLAHPTTLEQIEIDKKVLNSGSDSIEPGSTIRIRFNSANQNPIYASLK
jgi:translation elongation factor P/translation initiation factor 5A